MYISIHIVYMVYTYILKIFFNFFSNSIYIQDAKKKEKKTKKSNLILEFTLKRDARQVRGR